MAGNQRLVWFVLRAWQWTESHNRNVRVDTYSSACISDGITVVGVGCSTSADWHIAISLVQGTAQRTLLWTATIPRHSRQFSFHLRNGPKHLRQAFDNDGLRKWQQPALLPWCHRRCKLMRRYWAVPVKEICCQICGLKRSCRVSWFSLSELIRLPVFRMCGTL